MTIDDHRRYAHWGLCQINLRIRLAREWNSEHARDQWVDHEYLLVVHSLVKRWRAAALDGNLKTCELRNRAISIYVGKNKAERAKLAACLRVDF